RNAVSAVHVGRPLGAAMSVFDVRRLIDARLDISRIACSCQTWKSHHNHRIGGLVTLRGLYHPGSAGADDARFIKWKLDEFYDLYRVDGLVVDCRELDYTWGDNLSLQPSASHRRDHLPLLLVLRLEQQEAIAYAVPR